MPQRGLTFGLGPLVPVPFVCPSPSRELFLRSEVCAEVLQQVYSNTCKYLELLSEKEIDPRGCSVDAEKNIASVKHT